MKNLKFPKSIYSLRRIELVCYFYIGWRRCVNICDQLVCDSETVDEYIPICQKCEHGDKASCVEMGSRFGCWSKSGWWI